VHMHITVDSVTRMCMDPPHLHQSHTRLQRRAVCREASRPGLNLHRVPQCVAGVQCEGEHGAAYGSNDAGGRRAAVPKAGG
jgi:hypothetical protein